MASMAKKRIVAIVFLLLPLVIHAQEKDYKQIYESYVKRIENPSKEAKSQLEYVKSYFLTNGKEESEVYVVVLIRDQSWKWEQVYLRVLLWEEDQIGAQLVNEMTVVKGYPQGSEFVISTDRVVDWLIIHKDGEEEGNFILNFFSKE